MHKRIISLLLCAAMLLCLAACGSSESASTQTAASTAASTSAVETSTAPAEPEATLAASAAEAEETGIAGHYILTEVAESTETYGPEIIALFGEESFFDLKEDGTFELYLAFEEDTDVTGTWADTTITLEEGSLDFTYDETAKTILLDLEDEKMTFTHESVAPEIDYVHMEDGDGEWYDPSSDFETGGYVSFGPISYFDIYETVLYDDGSIRVTLTGVTEDGEYDYEVNYLIENTTDQPLFVRSDYFAVNGCLMNDMIYMDVPAGENVEGYISVPYEEAERAGITEFFELALYVRIQNSETWDTIGETGMVHVYYDDDTMVNGYTADPIPEGELLVDENGIQVSFLGLENDGFDDGYGYGYFTVVNNSGHTLYLYGSELTYNGQTVDDCFFAIVPDGFWTISALDIWSFQNAGLESYADITELGFKLMLCDNETMEPLVEEAAYTITIK